MHSRILSGNQTLSAMDLNDRGLNYGDGVFETILIDQSKPVWWKEHWQRLQKGLNRLGIAEPDQDRVLHEVRSLLSEHTEPSAVLKIVVTRGSGGRGYAADANAEPCVILSLHAKPAGHSTEGIRIRWCQTTLSNQPLLAGIKHLNRLEQVLARAEWDDAEIADGLMCNAEHQVVCATSANIFAYLDGEWLTPIIKDCGIAGIARSWLLQYLPSAREAELSKDDILRANAVFLSNAVRGVMPVLQLDSKRFPQMNKAYQVRELLANAVPGFAG